MAIGTDPSSSAAAVDPQIALRQVLRSWERRRRWRRVLRWLAPTATAVTGVWLCAQMLVRSGIWRPDVAGWWFYGCTVPVLVLALVALSWVTVVRDRSEVIARRLEPSCPRPQEQPISGAAALLDSDDGINWMRRRSAAVAVVIVDAVAPQALPRPPRRILYLLLPLALAAVASSGLGGGRGIARRTLTPWQADSLAIDYEIVILAPPVTRIGVGRSWRLEARCRPAAGRAYLELAFADGRRREIELAVEGERLEWGLMRVTEPFRYRVVVGADRSVWHQVAIGTVPRLFDLQRTLVPPGYTGQADRPWLSSAQEVLVGTRLEITARHDVAMAEAWLEDDRGERHPLRQDGGMVTGGITLDRDAVLQLVLYDADGHRHPAAVPWRVTVRPDRPPTVGISMVGNATRVPLERPVQVHIQAADDIGLHEVLLILRYADGTVIERLLPTEQVAQGMVLNLIPADHGMDDGEGLHLWVMAVDRGGQPASSERISIQAVGGAAYQRAGLLDWLAMAEPAMRRAAAACEGERWQWLRLRDGWYAADEDSFHAAVRFLSERANHHLTPLRDGLEDCPLPRHPPADAAEHQALLLAEELHSWVSAQRAWWRREQGRVEDGRPRLCGRMLASLRQAGEELTVLAERARRIRDAMLLRRLDRHLVAMGDQAERDERRDRRRLLWQTGGWRQGLSARFRDKRNGSGQRRWEGVMEPRFSDLVVPGLGRQEWQATFSGQIHFPVLGQGWLGVLADDGVRCWLDGRQILSDAAWSDQSPTRWGAIVTVDAAWHPIRIDHYQGLGGSHLEWFWGADAQTATGIPRERWRSLPPWASEIEGRLTKMIGDSASEPVASDAAALIAAIRRDMAGISPVLRTTDGWSRIETALLAGLDDDDAPSASVLKAQRSALEALLAVVEEDLRGEESESASFVRDPLLRPAWRRLQMAEKVLREQASWQWRRTILARHDTLLAEATADDGISVLDLLNASRAVVAACLDDSPDWEAAMALWSEAEDARLHRLVRQERRLGVAQDVWSTLGQQHLAWDLAYRQQRLRMMMVAARLRAVVARPIALAPRPAAERLDAHLLWTIERPRDLERAVEAAFDRRLSLLPGLMRVLADAHTDTLAIAEQYSLAAELEHLSAAGEVEAIAWAMLLSRQQRLVGMVGSGVESAVDSDGLFALTRLLAQWARGNHTSGVVAERIAHHPLAGDTGIAYEDARLVAAMRALEDLLQAGDGLTQSVLAALEEQMHASTVWRMRMEEELAAYSWLAEAGRRVADVAILRERRLRTGVPLGGEIGVARLPAVVQILDHDRRQIERGLLRPLALAVDERHAAGGAIPEVVEEAVAEIRRWQRTQIREQQRAQMSLRRTIRAIASLARQARRLLGGRAEPVLGPERRLRLAADRTRPDTLAHLQACRDGLTHAAALGDQWFWAAIMAETILDHEGSGSQSQEETHDEREAIARNAALLLRRIPDLVARTRVRLDQGPLVAPAVIDGPVPVEHMLAQVGVLAQLGVPEPRLLDLLQEDLYAHRLAPSQLAMTVDRLDRNDGRTADGPRTAAGEGMVDREQLRISEVALQAFGLEQQHMIRAYFAALAAGRWP